MQNTVYSPSTRARATALRRQGYTYTEICGELGRPIPKGTLSYWFKDIHLTPQQQDRIRAKINACGVQGRPLASEAWAKKIAQWREEIETRVKSFGRLPYTDPMIGKLVCGIMYVCEGGKYPSSRHLSFGNTDPNMIVAFLALLRRWYALDERKFRVRVMHRWDQDGTKLNHYWSQLTGIPLERFHRNYADARTRGKPTGRLSYRGICSIQYFDTSLQYELQAIGQAVIKNNGAGGN